MTDDNDYFKIRKLYVAAVISAIGFCGFVLSIAIPFYISLTTPVYVASYVRYPPEPKVLDWIRVISLVLSLVGFGLLLGWVDGSRKD